MLGKQTCPETHSRLGRPMMALRTQYPSFPPAQGIPFTKSHQITSNHQIPKLILTIQLKSKESNSMDTLYPLSLQWQGGLPIASFLSTLSLHHEVLPTPRPVARTRWGSGGNAGGPERPLRSASSGLGCLHDSSHPRPVSTSDSDRQSLDGGRSKTTPGRK